MRIYSCPSIQITEIDKSGYSPAMNGPACYVPGFATKGEPYKPMEFTSRAAFTNYYGEPDNEAERYFYAAACEVLNNNGRLYTARLPYDNEAFEKMVGVQYKVTKSEKCLSGDSALSVIYAEDNEIKDYYEINAVDRAITYSLDDINEYRSDEKKVKAGTFLIVDTTGATYSKVEEDNRKGQDREVIGIVPVVTTAPQGLYAQKMIATDQISLNQISGFEPIGKKELEVLSSDSGLKESDCVVRFNTQGYYSFITTGLSSMVKSATFPQTTPLSDVQISFKQWEVDVNASEVSCRALGIVTGSLSVNLDTLVSNPDTSLTGSTDYIWEGTSDAFVKLDESDPAYGWHNVENGDTVPMTMSLDAGNYFPTIQTASDGVGLDPTHLKDIGVVVYKMYLDPAEGNKVSYEPVEAFVGSLYKDAKDPNTGVTRFIDTIVNSQSEYINFFSNCFSTPADKKTYLTETDILVARPTECKSLGFFSKMTAEDISVSKSILDGLNKAFDQVADVIERDIDIVPDAGISNIAQFIKTIFGGKGQYDLSITDDLGNSLLGMWKSKTSDDNKMWKTVVQKFDNFCKNVRKDCMFITDCPRPLVIEGQKKIVRPSKPKNNIDVNILPYMKTIAGLNTSYGAGYTCWFEVADDYTGDFFWCPPSIKAMGCYVNTDVNFNYWDAPAGLTRGIIAATDVAFSPTWKQAGGIYEKSWNYAINYPNDGIILEGQKTLQTKPSALDRVNVRRLCLRLERMVFKVSRYFLYEGNTAYTRQRYVDAVDPYFKEAKAKGGLYDYKIVCDESNNIPETIDRNELHISIAIKPVKTIEWIFADFILGRTNSSWEELLG